MRQPRDVGMAGAELPHKPSNMNLQQVQDYMTLILEKVEQLGEHYVSRQLFWAVAELERMQGAA